MNNFLILMSGGTSPVINSTLVGIIDRVKFAKKKIYSAISGIEGVKKNKFIDLTNLSRKKLREMSLIPGSHFTGTSRISVLNKHEIQKIQKVLKKKDISNIINIGGNGTLKQTIDLSKKIPNINFASCPKTVDNDLGDKDFNKLLFNPGFLSCAEIWKFFLEMINIENIGACSHDKIIISQTFGRDTGFICGTIRYWDRKRKLPIMLLLPEDVQSFSKIYNHSKKIIKKYGRAMIFISEGYKIGNIQPKYDKSRQIMYGSSGNSACQILNNKFMKKGIQTRIFNPSILQRVFRFKKTILNKKDISIARKVGLNAANMLLNNKKSFLIGISSNGKINTIPFSNCLNFSRKMSKVFILKKKFDVSEEYLKYLKKVFKK